MLVIIAALYHAQIYISLTTFNIGKHVLHGTNCNQPRLITEGLEAVFLAGEMPMRVMMTIGLALLFAVSGLAQGTATTTATAVFQERSIFVTGSGNLVVFDTGRSTTGVTITGQRHSFYTPMTQITIQGKSSTQTVQYNGSLQVIGMGTAIYAIATTYAVSSTNALTTTQSLIAIDPTQSLPKGPALSFPSFALTSPVDASVGPNDFISLVSDPDNTARTATVVQFGGGIFTTFSSDKLP
jgi:hypothetical protein